MRNSQESLTFLTTTTPADNLDDMAQDNAPEPVGGG
jgi:hypothetical protein